MDELLYYILADVSALFPICFICYLSVTGIGIPKASFHSCTAAFSASKEAKHSEANSLLLRKGRDAALQLGGMDLPIFLPKAKP